MTRHISILALAQISFFMGIPAFAGSSNCSDASDSLHYDTYFQEGGPCCGRSTTTLTYKGLIIKQSEYIGAGPSGGGSRKDSNPGLAISETDQIDIGVPAVIGDSVIMHYTANLVLSRADGTPVLPDGLGSDETVTVKCVSTRSRVPRP